jgi:hypothetical protein
METKTRLPAFKGKPLIEIPTFIPQVGFMEGYFGKAFSEEYQGRVKADYQNSSALNVLNYRNDIVSGSNPFAVVLANQILGQEGLRTATQADLEKALKVGALNLRGFYEDTGLVLRSEEDRDYSRNNALSRELAKQVKERGIKLNQRNPVMIPLIGLEVEKADNDYGLTFILKEDAEIYNVPILNQETGSFSSEDIDEKTGLPVKLGQGNRTLYTRNSGLSRLYLGNLLSLTSGSGGLDGSGGGGRVVVVSAEGTSPQNLQDELYFQINGEYKAQLEELNSRKAQAEKAVRDIMSRKR